MAAGGLRLSVAGGPTRPVVEVLPDPESLARRAAREIAKEIRQALSGRGECVMALPGGGTPAEALELLAQEPEIAWGRTVMLVADERLVPLEEPRSNEAMLRRSLVERIDGDRPLVLGWEIEPGLGPEMLSQRMEARLLGVVPYVDGHPRLDVLVLGLGEDGHTASLFPGQSYPAAALVLSSRHPEGERRLTLGPLVLRSAGCTRFLVQGANKATALAQVVEGAYDPVRWPAQLVARSAPGCRVWCDAEAAQRLSKASR